MNKYKEENKQLTHQLSQRSKLSNKSFKSNFSRRTNKSRHWLLDLGRLAARVASVVTRQQENHFESQSQKDRHSSVGQHRQLNQNSDSEGEEEYQFADPKQAQRTVDQGGVDAGGVNLANQRSQALGSQRRSQKELNLSEVNDFINN